MNQNDKYYFADKEILITGGTGSLGKTLLKKLFAYNVSGIRIFSRDELKQWELKNQLEAEGYNLSKVAFIIGDVRDEERLKRAFQGVDIVINAAAMKHVPACENDPIEAVKTNILGAINIINASLDCDVAKVVHISTDKAVYPVNLYGATKTVAEKLFCDANIYRGGNYRTAFGCIRYGNILGSRGSILPFFQSLYKQGKVLPITSPEMTRFFLSLDTVADFILSTIPEIMAGEIHIPKMKSVLVADLVGMIWPDAETKDIGIRKGEKIHECLITKEEKLSCIETLNSFVIHSDYYTVLNDDEPLTSENNKQKLTIEDVPNEYTL